MNNNEREQLSVPQEQEKINTETPETEKPELAEGLEKDPRIDAIKNELTSEWKSAHGSEYDERGVLSAEYQNFLFGDPSDWRRGKEPISLNKRAEQRFAERFPDDTKKYAEQEKKRAYENPADDPAIKEVEKNIARITNKDHDEEMQRENATGGQSMGIWNKNFNRVFRQQWENFLTLYPEKAAAYREKFEPIKGAFEREERWQKIQEERAAVARSMEQLQKDKPVEQPAPVDVKTEKEQIAEVSEKSDSDIETGSGEISTKPSRTEQSFAKKIEDFSHMEEIGREIGKNPEEQPEEKQGKDFFSIFSSFHEPHRFEIDSGRTTQRIIEVQPRGKSIVLTETSYSGSPRIWEIFEDGRVTLEESGGQRDVDIPAGQSMMRQRMPEIKKTRRGREALAELKRILEKFSAGVKDRTSR